MCLRRCGKDPSLDFRNAGSKHIEVALAMVRCIGIFLACWLGVVAGPSDALEAMRPVVAIMPAAPTATDNIQVTADYPAGPYVQTQSHTIDGNVVTVHFVQDGWDFFPNPPHGATENIGRLAPGTYQFVVTSTLPSASVPSVQRFQVVVRGVAVPIGFGVSVLLAVLLLMLGVLSARNRWLRHTVGAR